MCAWAGCGEGGASPWGEGHSESAFGEGCSWCAGAGREQQLHRHPLTMNSAEHVEIDIGAKGSHPLGRYLHNLAALSPGVK